MTSAVRRCREGLRGRLAYQACSKEPRAASSLVATSFRVGEMAAGSPDWSNSSTRPRDPRTASRRMRVPARLASSGAEPSSTVSRSSTANMRRRSSRPRPDQEIPIDPAQGRVRGQTTPPPARPLQSQPSRLVDDVTVQGGASLPRLQGINLLAPPRTRKVRLFRQPRPPGMRTATGLHSAMG